MRRNRPTVRDVAERAGVSAATVSIVLRGGEGAQKRATEETRQRVVQAAAELGYIANQAARGLRRGRAENVLLAIRWPDSPWSQAIAADVGAVAEGYGYTAVSLAAGDWLNYLGRGTADGAIIDATGDGSFDTEAVAPLIQQGLALVVFNNRVEPDGFDVVRTNERRACADAMRDLIDRGHRRIACLRHEPAAKPEDLSERFAAYRAALEENGIAYDESLVRDVHGSREIAYQQALDLLQGPDRPSAIYAVGDLVAISALWAAHRLRLRVPEDIAIVGVGNTPESALTDPPLTTVGPVKSDFHAIGELLFDRLNDTDPLPGRVHYQEWSLIRRGTT